MKEMKKLGWLAAVVFVVAGAAALAQNLSSCPTLNCWEDSGASTALGDTVTIGGTMNVASGGTLNVQSGGALQQAGVPITLASSAVEVVTATNVITAAESGTTFFLNSGTEFVSTLPVPAAGLRYTFIIAAAPAAASYTIVTNASANIINIVAMAGGATDAADVATAQDVITFVDAQAVVGDWVYCISDGTSWQCTGMAAVVAGLTTGAT
jgi:hypothetical protein